MDRISRVLAAIVRRRAIVLVVFALLVPAAVVEVLRIPSDGGIDRLIVASDPDYIATQAFHRVFPEAQIALVTFESSDPWSPAELARFQRATAAIGAVPHVATFSALDAIRHARPAATVAEIERLARGTAFFRQQALVGDHFMTLVASLDVHDAASRDRVLDSIDVSLARAGALPARKIGAPYVASWIERQSAGASAQGFPVFAILLAAIAIFLFRSWRAMLAILGALGAAVALAVAAGGLMGFAFTIVSVLVPLTILVTTLASLVYLHSRFVDHPEGVSLEDHHLIALRNKFRPVTASTLAAAMGFAALGVSKIRPIREMGIWTSIGLVIAWFVVYTLFPALQRVLRAPTGRVVQTRRGVYDRLADALPAFTYRHRWLIVIATLAACAVGAALLIGVPGVVGGARVEVDTLANLDASSPIHRDLEWFRDHVTDLNVARVWIHLPQATATDPEVLRAIDGFQRALEAVPHVTGVTGPTTMLRMRSYVAGRGEALPTDPDAFAAATVDLEQLMLTEPELRAFIDVGGLADLQLVVQFEHGDAAGYAAIASQTLRAWDVARTASPALAGARAQIVGEALLSAKVGANLVPTLAESFVLTAGLIFVVFLALFRSGVERLLAMIPSLFALLVTFLGMRLLGGTLNVATIIIATTVLGTTENDQIHFFHHMHERSGEPLEVRLRHALRVSGSAIVFATLINATGFLGLAASSFPPLRQFGLMTAAAFVLALIADFIALPAALWLQGRSPVTLVSARNPAELQKPRGTD
jgi:uncharacterized protein